jgi:hypothetical protein
VHVCPSQHSTAREHAPSSATHEFAVHRPLTHVPGPQHVADDAHASRGPPHVGADSTHEPPAHCSEPQDGDDAEHDAPAAPHATPLSRRGLVIGSMSPPSSQPPSTARSAPSIVAITRVQRAVPPVRITTSLAPSIASLETSPSSPHASRRRGSKSQV